MIRSPNTVFRFADKKEEKRSFLFFLFTEFYRKSVGFLKKAIDKQFSLWYNKLSDKMPYGDFFVRYIE